MVLVIFQDSAPHRSSVMTFLCHVGPTVLNARTLAHAHAHTPHIWSFTFSFEGAKECQEEEEKNPQRSNSEIVLQPPPDGDVYFDPITGVRPLLVGRLFK